MKKRVGPSRISRQGVCSRDAAKNPKEAKEVKFGSNDEKCEIQPKREENGRGLLRLSGAFFDGSDGEQRADFPQKEKDQ
jgi:hypothetical protein